MAEEVRLAKPKLMPLSESEHGEAVRLLAAMLRAVIASRPVPAAAKRRPPDGPEVPRRRERRPHGMSPMIADTLPMARRANGKRASRETAGEKP